MRALAPDLRQVDAIFISDAPRQWRDRSLSISRWKRRLLLSIGWLLRGRFCLNWSFLTSTRGDFGAFTNLTKHISHGNHISLLFENLLQHATLLGTDLDIDLLGLQFHKRLTLFHFIPFTFKPSCNYCIDY